MQSKNVRRGRRFIFVLTSAVAAFLVVSSISCIRTDLIENKGPGSGRYDMQSAERELSGTYNVTGTDENGNDAYTGSLSVNNQGDAYRFRWTTNHDRHEGVGIQIGDSVAASYASTGGGAGCGVVLYKIASDGSLNGRIAHWGEYTYGTEQAVRTEGTGFPGMYSVTGRAADGKEYKGTLKITKDGSGYDFEWKTDKPYVAFGIWKGSSAAASFGGTKCGFALFSVEASGDLDGRWGGQKAITFGTEKGKRQ
jgi:hypothetical protein